MNDFMLKLAARREQGQTMVEYGLILALVSVVAVATLVLVGGDIKSTFQTIANDL
jgi:pilus assembly protein Flp/PilA